MQSDEKIFINRIKDLANITYTQNRYTFSHFLTIEEQGIINQIETDIRHVPHDFFGGNECCERQIIRFGSIDSLGYEEDYPITVLLIEPLIDKFSDDLSHRDYLGALMKLGIKRQVIGDILLKNNKAYVFCLNEIADVIMSEITRVKHTSVKISRVSGDVEDLKYELEDFDLLVSSPRCDAVVAALTNLSRGKALDLFREKKVVINNRVCENNSLILKAGSYISIRGYGKYIYEGEGGRTRKDRVYLHMKRYV